MSFEKLLAVGKAGEEAVAESLEAAGYKVTFLNYQYHAADFLIEKGGERRTVEVKLHQRCKSTADGIWPAFNVEVKTATGAVPGHFSETVDIFVNIDEVEEKAYFYDAGLIRLIYKSSHMKSYIKPSYLDGVLSGYICPFSLPKTTTLIGPALNNLSCKEITKISASYSFDIIQGIEGWNLESPLYLGCRKIKIKKE